MAWALVDVSPDGETLDIAYVEGDGECIPADGFSVVKTPTSFNITAFSPRHRDSCAVKLMTGRVTVALQSPLGARSPLHPPTQFGDQV